MFTACLQHCRYLSLSQNGDQTGFCVDNALNCEKHRKKFRSDPERKAMENTLKQFFRLDQLSDRIDIVELIEAIMAPDKKSLDQLLDNGVSPRADWIQADYAGVGSDWGGTKVSLVYRIDHPHLKAALGLVLNASEVTLTLGRIDYANAAAFCRLTPTTMVASYPKTGHVAGRAETKAGVQFN